MKMHSIPVQTTEVEMEVNDESITDDADDEHQEISASADGRDKKEELRDDSAHETLKAEFMSEYVRYDHQKDTIYEVFEVLFLEKKSGAFAAHAFKCAMDEKWLKCFLVTRQQKDCSLKKTLSKEANLIIRMPITTSFPLQKKRKSELFFWTSSMN